MAINLKKDIFEEDIIPVDGINLEKPINQDVKLEKTNTNTQKTTQKTSNNSLSNSGGLNKIAVKLVHGNTTQKKYKMRRKLKLDCDLAAIFIGHDGTIVGNNGVDSCVFYGRPNAYDNSVVLTGDGSGNTEVYVEHLYIDTSRIPQDVKRVVFVVTIYDGYFNKQSFGLTKSLEVQVLDVDKQQEMDYIEITERFRHFNGLICGEIVKVDGRWTYNYVEKPLRGVRNIGTVLQMFV